MPSLIERRNEIKARHAALVADRKGPWHADAREQRVMVPGVGMTVNNCHGDPDPDAMPLDQRPILLLGGREGIFLGDCVETVMTAFNDWRDAVLDRVEAEKAAWQEAVKEWQAWRDSGVPVEKPAEPAPLWQETAALEAFANLQVKQGPGGVAALVIHRADMNVLLWALEQAGVKCCSAGLT